VPSALRYFTVTSATLLNLFTLRISTLFCMDRLWGKARQSSTLSDTFFHFSFRFLSNLDIAAWHTYCTQHIPCQPPHFSKNFGLAFWLAGGRGLISFSPNKRIAFIYRYHSPLLDIITYIYYIKVTLFSPTQNSPLLHNCFILF
jgi:hypothetical protein